MSLPAARYPKIKNALDRKREVQIAWKFKRMFPTVQSNCTPKIFKIAQRLVPQLRIIPEASPYRKAADFKIELTPHLLLDRYHIFYGQIFKNPWAIYSDHFRPQFPERRKTWHGKQSCIVIKKMVSKAGKTVKKSLFLFGRGHATQYLAMSVGLSVSKSFRSYPPVRNWRGNE